MDSEKVQAWIEVARGVLTNADEWPLIDDREALGKLWFAKEMLSLWNRRDPSELDEVWLKFDSFLDPDQPDPAARFVALSFFYFVTFNQLGELLTWSTWAWGRSRLGSELPAGNTSPSWSGGRSMLTARI